MSVPAPFDVLSPFHSGPLFQRAALYALLAEGQQDDARGPSADSGSGADDDASPSVLSPCPMPVTISVRLDEEHLRKIDHLRPRPPKNPLLSEQEAVIDSYRSDRDNNGPQVKPAGMTPRALEGLLGLLEGPIGSQVLALKHFCFQ